MEPQLFGLDVLVYSHVTQNLSAPSGSVADVKVFAVDEHRGDEEIEVVLSADTELVCPVDCPVTQGLQLSLPVPTRLLGEVLPEGRDDSLVHFLEGLLPEGPHEFLADFEHRRPLNPAQGRADLAETGFGERAISWGNRGAL